MPIEAQVAVAILSSVPLAKEAVRSGGVVLIRWPIFCEAHALNMQLNAWIVVVAALASVARCTILWMRSFASASADPERLLDEGGVAGGEGHGPFLFRGFEGGGEAAHDESFVVVAWFESVRASGVSGWCGLVGGCGWRGWWWAG